MKELLRSLLVIGSSLVVAAGAAAALLTFAFGDIRMFPFIFVVTLVIGAVIGLPLFFLIRSRGQANWRTAVITGFFVVAVVPAVLLIVPGADQASTGGVPTVVDGSYTAFGWLQNLVVVGFFGCAGSLGGLFFWRIVRGGPALLMDDFAEKADPPKTLSGKGITALASAAAALIGAAVAIPAITKDRSCHNTLRDGRNSIGPEAKFELKVSSREWSSVAHEVEAFGRAGGWSILSDVRPDESFKWFQLSLCREPGTNIAVDRLNSRTVSFGVYQPQGGSSWKAPFTELYRRIRDRWPDRIEFTGDVGERIDPPAWVPEQDQTPSHSSGGGNSSPE